MDIEKAHARPLTQMVGEDEEESQLFRVAAEDALTYLKSYAWCNSVIEGYFCFGIGGVVEVFLFRIDRQEAGEKTVDEWLWVIVGDLPFAYLVTDVARSPKEALHTYCDLMRGWVAAVLSKGDLSDVYPVAVEPTIENASLLSSRIDFLEEEIIPLT